MSPPFGIKSLLRLGDGMEPKIYNLNEYNEWWIGLSKEEILQEYIENAGYVDVERAVSCGELDLDYVYEITNLELTFYDEELKKEISLKEFIETEQDFSTPFPIAIDAAYA